MNDKKRRRGGWPRGVNRNPDCGRWDSVLYDLIRLLESVDIAGSRRTGISRRQLAKHCGVDDAAVRNWLRRIDRPPIKQQLSVERWVSDRASWRTAIEDS